MSTQRPPAFARIKIKYNNNKRPERFLYFGSASNRLAWAWNIYTIHHIMARGIFLLWYLRGHWSSSHYISWVINYYRRVNARPGRPATIICRIYLSLRARASNRLRAAQSHWTGIEMLKCVFLYVPIKVISLKDMRLECVASCGQMANLFKLEWKIF
jgi:hypothetical protein